MGRLAHRLLPGRHCVRQLKLSQLIVPNIVARPVRELGQPDADWSSPPVGTGRRDGHDHADLHGQIHVRFLFDQTPDANAVTADVLEQ